MPAGFSLIYPPISKAEGHIISLILSRIPATIANLVYRETDKEASKFEIFNRRPCINTCTGNFHFLVSFDLHTGHPVEFFTTGRGKVGQQLGTELCELSVKASQLMQGEFEDDLPRMRERDDRGLGHQRPNPSAPRKHNPDASREIF